LLALLGARPKVHISRIKVNAHCNFVFRPPGTKQLQAEMYKKDRWATFLTSSDFKHKFCALVFLRIKNRGYRFKLASNVKGLGKFDDIALQYLDDYCKNFHMFGQIKIKAKQHITTRQLVAHEGDFSLRKYYKSYMRIEEKFNRSELGVKMDGSVGDSLFIIYTNADVSQELKSNTVTDIVEENLLMAGGSVLQFDEEKHKSIYYHLQDLPKHREFLGKFRILYNQAEGLEMDRIIKIELQRNKNLPKIEVDVAYSCFIDRMKDWWQHKDFVLQETNSRRNDPFRKPSSS
jgi:hypothetical protein